MRMSDSGLDFTTANADLEALEADPDLMHLGSLLNRFNIFEAIGAVRQELRHSDFLAFLLNPKQSHGLADAFTKRLLREALSDSIAHVEATEINTWSFKNMVVRREWQNIDILLVDDVHKLAVIIENKIGTGEHSNQLQNYRSIVHNHYAGWNIVGFYLSPSGSPPSDGTYLPISYGLVCDLLDELADAQSSTIEQDVLTALRHYTQMVRRHIVGESEIDKLCQHIYKKHRKALDQIYHYQTRRLEASRRLLQGLIRETDKLVLDRTDGIYIRFAPQEWDSIPALRTGNTWSNSKRVLLFEFINKPDSLVIKQTIGPGPETTRRRLLLLALSKQPPFIVPGEGTLSPYTPIYTFTLIDEEQYSQLSEDDLKKAIRHAWSDFVQLPDNLSAIRAAIQQEQWT
jgi:hypothetical protein